MKKKLIIAILFVTSYSCFAQGSYSYNGRIYYTHKSFDEMMNPKDKVDLAISVREIKMETFFESFGSVNKDSRTFHDGKKYFYASVCDTVLIYLIKESDTTAFVSDLNINQEKSLKLKKKRNAIESEKEELIQKWESVSKELSEKKFLKKEHEYEVKKNDLNLDIQVLENQIESLRPKSAKEKIIDYLITTSKQVQSLSGSEIVFKKRRNHVSSVYRDFYMFEDLPLFRTLYITIQ